MPSGIVHNTTTIIAANAALVIVAFNVGDVGPALFALPFGVLSGIFLTPDLDVDHPTASHRAVKRTFRVAGGCMFTFWRVLWFPYGKLISHRHWVSHFPFISTVIRVAYLFTPVALFLTLTAATHEAALYRFFSAPAFIFWFAGLLISDILHWFLDLTVSFAKRSFARIAK